jgi:hypothetical protein
LKDLYNKAQLECTSLDRCGAFHLVALNKDWDEHPGNIVTTIIPGTPGTPPTTAITIRPRPIIVVPQKPDPTDSQKAFSRFVYEMSEIEKWDKAKAALQSAIINSLGPANVAIINANTPSEIASLSCKDLVQWVETKSNITTDEIELVEETLSTPLAHFSEFEDHVANTNMNYTFLSKHNHILPPLMWTKLFTQSLSRFDNSLHIFLLTKTTLPHLTPRYTRSEMERNRILQSRRQREIQKQQNSIQGPRHRRR